MFRLSQKADYGLILLSSLAKFHSRSEAELNSGAHSGSVTSDGYFSISKIAAQYKLSPKFLSQIAQALKKGGILASREGVLGGYTLAKSAEQIKLLDVLKILEGEFFEGQCFKDEAKCICGAKGIWKDMRDQVQSTLSKKTVADLMVI